MGLDMYFTAKKYLGGGYDHMKNTEEARKFDAILDILDVPRESVLNFLQVELEVGYLRKANAIHSWLVRNIQDGKDECQESYFDVSKITELRDVIRKILATVEKGGPIKHLGWEEYPDLKLDTALAAELLEPTSGFFFGSQDYDEGYVHNLEIADGFLTRMLEDPALKDAEFYYRASW